jgi:hypothetical protein
MKANLTKVRAANDHGLQWFAFGHIWEVAHVIFNQWFIALVARFPAHTDCGTRWPAIPGSQFHACCAG